MAELRLEPVWTLIETTQVPLARPMIEVPDTAQIRREDFATVRVTRDVFVVVRAAHFSNDAREAPRFNAMVGCAASVVAGWVIVARMVGVECVNPDAVRRIQPSLSLTLVTTEFVSAPVSMTSMVDLMGAEVNL